MKEDALRKRLAAMERKLAAMEHRRASVSEEPAEAEPTLAAAIDDVERRLSAMTYMDEEFVEEEVGAGDDSSYMDDEEFMEPGMSYMDEDDMEPGCGGPGMEGSESRSASESRPGVEDQITQDYLDDVEALRPGADTRETAESMLDVAPTEYVARLMKASRRLDRVAAYLEGNGRKDLALRIDKIADAIDDRIKGGLQ